MYLNKAGKKIINAAYDMRFLLSRGYTRKNSLKIVANRYELTRREQMILYRGVYDDKTAARHLAKKVTVGSLKKRTLGVDWYNVYITVEGGLMGELVIMSDDGFLRDIRGIYGKMTRIGSESPSLHKILTKINTLNVKKVCLYLDAVISKSGELRRILDNLIEHYSINAKALTVKTPDIEISKCDIVASSDSVVIERSKKVFDLAEFTLSGEKIQAISLK